MDEARRSVMTQWTGLALTAGASVLIALAGRVGWDAAYRSNNPALIGEYFVFFWAIGIVTGLGMRVVVGSRWVTKVALALVVNVPLGTAVGAAGDGFVGFRPAGLAMGWLLAAVAAPVGVGLGTLVERALRRQG